MRLRKQILTHNNCYTVGWTIRPAGVMVHSTGANNPKVSRYVPGDSVLGYNIGGNHWDQTNAQWEEKFGEPLDRCVHAIIGKWADGKVGTVQTLTWNRRAWHCGKGRKGTANDTHIAFEICEDGLTDESYFSAVYQEAVELTAYLCKEYGLDPLEDGVVICHSEGYRRGVASNHGDVMHWFPKFGKNMDGFRVDMSRELNGEEDMTQEQFNQMMAEYERTKNPVPDNTPEGWEARAVQWARDNGLLAGDLKGNLMLHSNMTRAQFFVILKKYHEKRNEVW